MWLTVMSGAEQGTRVEVSGDRFVVGREDSCDFVLNDEKVSRQHAYLQALPDGRAVLHDLDSSNGTYVDGRRISTPVTLRGEEHLRFGDTTLACSLKPSPPPAAATRPAAPAPPSAQAPGVGRSTVQRIVRDALRGDERAIRRSVRLAAGLGLVAVAAAATLGALFATGTIGRENGSGPPIATLERATVLIEGVNESGDVEYIGSGSIIRRDGIILTNAHVGAPKAPGLDVQYGPGTTSDPEPAALRIAFFQGEAKAAEPLYLAEALASDGYADVAVLKIVKTVDGGPVGELDLPVVPIGDSNRLRDGEPVTVVGYPGVGGGFERAINVSRGTVSGFQRDSHVPSVRGWIKTDAAIAHGNSGGLAADSAGRLIGIPTRIQCGSSLSNPCSPGEDTQGKIRPIALALPVIRAAEAGRTITSPYVVQGTGKEKFDFQDWALNAPDSSCNFKAVQSYSSDAKAYTAVFDVSGMAPGEDLAFVAFYASKNTETPEVVDQFQDRWRQSGGGSASCFYVTFPTGPSGTYSMQVFAGPELRPVSKEIAVKVGS